MHIDLVSDSRKKLPVHHDVEAVGSLRIWQCRYDSLMPLEEYINLKTLVVDGVPDEHLDFLSDLRGLRYLSLTGLPKVQDLSPLARLQGLECVTLENKADYTGRGSEVDSFDPLARLPNLRHVAILGIKPRDRTLSGLERLRNLQTAIFDSLPSSEVQRFYGVMGNLAGRIPAPIYDPYYVAKPRADDM